MSKSGARIIKAAGEAVLHAQVERLQADVARLTAERDAALAGAVRVKSLVWKKRDIDIHLAQNYRITPFYGQGPAAYYLARGSDMIADGDTVDDLKSTAQADHERSVRAAIEPASPSVSGAETVLAALDPEALRPILSRLANHTPNSCYYSKDFGESMRALPEKAATEAGKMLPLEQGLMFVAATAADRLAPGDKLDAEFTSLMHGAKDIGSYRVQIERLATKENSNE